MISPVGIASSAAVGTPTVTTQNLWDGVSLTFAGIILGIIAVPLSRTLRLTLTLTLTRALRRPSLRPRCPRSRAVRS